jgi:hypothetical protein
MSRRSVVLAGTAVVLFWVLTVTGIAVDVSARHAWIIGIPWELALVAYGLSRLKDRRVHNAALTQPGYREYRASISQ